MNDAISGVADAGKAGLRVRQPRLSSSPTGLAFLVIFWLATVVAGIAGLLAYSGRAGAQGSPIETWPAGEGLTFVSGRFNLIVFAHPRCACTEATMSELERLLSDCPGRLDTQVVFLQPESETEEWSQTPLRRRVERMSGVAVRVDAGGRLALSYGVQTSGHTLLYDGRGQLVFEGGITPARGHEGNNSGRSAITSLVNGGQPGEAPSPVFGCPLRNQAVTTEGPT